jgi:hypothetical protein
MKIIVDKRWADSTPMTWEESAVGTHVALPLDVSQVSDAVVEKVAKSLYADSAMVKAGVVEDCWKKMPQRQRAWYGYQARAAIAALAQALEEEA